MKKKAVLALGGNALIREGQRGNVYEQFANTRMSLDGVIELLRQDYSVVITHGNGPQAGHELIKNELAAKETPCLPLGIIDAETQGFIGYMIAQSLINRLKKENIKRDVCVIITQVLVNKDDPSIHNPTKFVGRFYSEEEIKKLTSKNWIIKKDRGRGYRRVVPSPEPIDIIEKNTIEYLLNNDNIVIAVGGGGIPVYYDNRGSLEGMDAVIDKDKASALLAIQIKADAFFILTAEKYVCINYRKTNEQHFTQMSIEQAKIYLDQGHFPQGSMGPKMESMIKFVQSTGNNGRIGSTDLAKDVVNGKSGTLITK